ncbi:hypothetical protein GSI_08570 [Ganoderma sinense ZZ0214-1]|uniref:Uncharacterized protein n=1 Tax=Ganoderma sinense ZZ0214-1 TaxID=1077348 RepID=A0A2G8S438_9APHY|nr:hypothetical protein GSI_08570 [Ganoderma sinense ZZ0214-1]
MRNLLLPSNSALPAWRLENRSMELPFPPQYMGLAGVNSGRAWTLEASSVPQSAIVPCPSREVIFWICVEGADMITPRPMWLILATAIFNVAGGVPPAFDIAPQLDHRCPPGFSTACRSLGSLSPRGPSTGLSTPNSTSTSISTSNSTSPSTSSSGSASVGSSSATHSSSSVFSRTSLSSSTNSSSISITSASASRSRNTTAATSPSSSQTISSFTLPTSLSPSSNESTQSVATSVSSSPKLADGSSISVTLVLPTSSTPSPGTTSSHPPKMSTGGIIGAVVAIIGFLWLAALALWWVLRKWRASSTQAAREGGADWHLSAHRYEHTDAEEAPGNKQTAFSDALQPVAHHGYDQPAVGFGGSDKEAMLLDPSSPPHHGAESPATLVDRPLAQNRPESLKNTELLALAGTDYSVAVAHARSRSASAPQRLPATMATPVFELGATFGEELTRTSTNPFRARLHAAEVARRQGSLVENHDRDWWAAQSA